MSQVYNCFVTRILVPVEAADHGIVETPELACDIVTETTADTGLDPVVSRFLSGWNFIERVDYMGYCILISALFAVLVWFIAAKRNANRSFWLAMGILFGPFALPFVFFAKPSHRNT